MKRLRACCCGFRANAAQCLNEVRPLLAWYSGFICCVFIATGSSILWPTTRTMPKPTTFHTPTTSGKDIASTLCYWMSFLPGGPNGLCGIRWAHCSSGSILAEVGGRGWPAVHRETGNRPHQSRARHFHSDKEPQGAAKLEGKMVPSGNLQEALWDLAYAWRSWICWWSTPCLARCVTVCTLACCVYGNGALTHFCFLE